MMLIFAGNIIFDSILTSKADINRDQVIRQQMVFNTTLFLKGSFNQNDKRIALLMSANAIKTFGGFSAATLAQLS